MILMSGDVCKYESEIWLIRAMHTIAETALISNKSCLWMIDCIIENCYKKVLYTETAFNVHGP